MTVVDDATTRALRLAYERKAAERDHAETFPWKAAERDAFVAALRQNQTESVLDIGAGPGRDALFFKEQGLAVTCIDLSPSMVDLCRAKGLVAAVMDMRELAFPDGAFDAAYAFNSLLHIPKAELPAVLAEIRRVLRPGGLFYLGVYGGRASEGVWEEDTYRPRRHFSLYADDELQQAVEQVFTVADFRAVDLGDAHDGLHFQALMLRRPDL